MAALVASGKKAHQVVFGPRATAVMIPDQEPVARERDDPVVIGCGAQ